MRSRWIGASIAVAAVGAVLAGSAVATVALRSEIDARGVKKVTVVRNDEVAQTTSTSYSDVPGMTATINLPRAGILLADFNAESQCYDEQGSFSWCSVRVIVDGVGELEPAAGSNYAFDSTNNGGDANGSWEGNALQRSSNALAPGTYTVRVQWAVVGIATFWLDDMHLTVQAVQL